VSIQLTVKHLCVHSFAEYKSMLVNRRRDGKIVNSKNKCIVYTKAYGEYNEKKEIPWKKSYEINGSFWCLTAPKLTELLVIHGKRNAYCIEISA
jgi:hypothetical protein